MKKLTELKNEKAQYYVCVNGVNEFESTSLLKCKNWLCTFLKHFKDNGIKIENTCDYYIGMYSISIE